MRGMQEETFGPTLPIATFTTEEEAIRLANDSEFGLTASVWTRDHAKGKRVAEKIEAGSVCVNEVLYTHGIGQTPWGGFKNSGRGRHARPRRPNGTRPAAAHPRQPHRASCRTPGGCHIRETPSRHFADLPNILRRVRCFRPQSFYLSY